MQTSSRVDLNDNWKDIGQHLMNIRPVGTYTKPGCCKPKPYHHPAPIFNPHGCPYPCPAPQHIDPHPHHHCPEPHTWPMDLDGDGFVEGDIIAKPLIPYGEPPVPVAPEPEIDPDFTVDEDNTTDDTSSDITDSDDTTNTDITSIDEQKQVYGIEHIEDNWLPSKIIDTETQTVVVESSVESEEYKTIEEPVIKPTRRVNRGGRRKKDI